MKTNDNFKNVEEYEHILKERNESFEESHDKYSRLPQIDKSRSNINTRLATNRVNSQ